MSDKLLTSSQKAILPRDLCLQKKVFRVHLINHVYKTVFNERGVSIAMYQSPLYLSHRIIVLNIFVALNSLVRFI